MTQQAYNSYLLTCELKGITPSEMSDLEFDPLNVKNPHEHETPIHIRKPRDYTGTRKTFEQHMADLSGDRKYLITKAQLLEFAEMVLRDAKPCDC